MTLEATLGKVLRLSSAKDWAVHLEPVFDRFDILSHERQAMFLAQCAHESGGFSTLVENLNYSARMLRATWPARFPDDEVAALYARRPTAIANKVYANRLGNGNEASADGWKYRGRGLIQITGKTNYEAVGVALGFNALKYPEQLETKRYAAASAGWFWQSRGLNDLADENTQPAFEEITRRINGGTHGLVNRLKLWNSFKEAL